MTRLKGGGSGNSWIRIVLTILLIIALMLLLDYFDVIPLHLI